MARDVFVVTHAQSRHHVEGKGGGWYDTPLTELGRRQADALADRLGEIVDGRPVELFASDLMRAAQTADAIAGRLGVRVVSRSDLRERNVGEAGGKPIAWADARRVPPPRLEGRLDHDEGFGDAETMRAFLTRIYGAMDQILESGCATQVIVTHGFALTCVVAAWIKMPLEAAAWVNFRSRPCALTHLHEDDDYFNRAVLLLNDTSHLAGLH